MKRSSVILLAAIVMSASVGAAVNSPIASAARTGDKEAVKALLKDVTDAIAQADAHVGDLHAESLRGGRVRIRMRLRVPGFEELSRLLGKLERLPGVERARRG